MAIETEEPLLHWNYFLALESDMNQIARFIEFTKKNFKTHSIELAHLLLATSSEIDVVAKQICAILDATERASNINGYQKIITKKLPQFCSEKIFIPRHNLTLTPWTNWTQKKNPFWWRSYNNVKHERTSHFEEANLQNALNALAALLVTVFYYYKLKFGRENQTLYEAKETNRKLEPESQLFRLQKSYYYSHLIV